jgi:hypothetical protein
MERLASPASATPIKLRLIPTCLVSALIRTCGQNSGAVSSVSQGDSNYGTMKSNDENEPEDARVSKRFKKP